MKKLPYVLAPAALVSLAAGFFACGSYSSPSTGSAGASPNGSGGDTTGSAGAPVNPSGGSSNPSGGDASGGALVDPGGGSGNDSAGGTASGGSGNAAGASGAGGGTVTTGGTGGTPGAAGSGGAPPVAIPLPCGVLAPSTQQANKCVSAHSTIRVIVPGYTGPLYQLCKGTSAAGPSSCKGTAQDVASKDGYADNAAHEAFCGTGTCKITKIYDQSGMKNDLEPAPAGGPPGPQPDDPANAGALKTQINGHTAYGVLIVPGMGYRTGCSGCNIKTGNGMAINDEPQTMYWVTSQNDLKDGCCFDYGNAETTSHDDGNGTMEALYFGNNHTWGTGKAPGPWAMADLENGLYAGWENKQDQAISTNVALKHDFVSAMVLGDTRDKNATKGRFAIFGGDATAGTLTTLYDNIRPEKTGYAPMKKQGSIILGIGGDNSKGAGGRFYEGAIVTGPVVSKTTLDSLQVALVAAKYGK